MVLAPECRDEVLSIAKKNSLLTEPCLTDDDFVSPNLEEQYIETQKATSLKLSSGKCNEKWRLSNLEDILQSFKSGQLTFVGPAGSGKTTLVKMITQSVIQHKYESLRNVELVFIIDNTITENVAVTGWDIIFKSLLSAGMNDKSRIVVMDYVKMCPDRVLFVLDGLDTMKLEYVGTSDRITIDDKALPAEHLGNLLSGRYLKGCRIITSGRNQVLRSFDKKVHPKRVVALTGLPKPGITKVISGYLGKEKAENVFYRLESKMKPLLALCSSPAILKYTLCVIDTYDGIINTLTDLFMIILERLVVDSDNNELDRDVIIKNLKQMAFDGVKDKDVVFSKPHLQQYRLSESQVTCLSLPCGWDLNYKLIQKCSHYFFTHMSMQEAFAALYLAALPKADYENFIQNDVNHPEFILVRRFLHGMLSSNCKGTKNNIATVEDADFKLKKLFMNDASILKKHFSQGGNKDYQEILEIFYCLYESQEMPYDIRLIIKRIELKNLPISASDAHAIGWVISRCSEIDEISFWNCTLNSSVFETLEEAVADRNVKIGSLNIHENDGFDPPAMNHIGKIAGHCNVNGMVFQGCEVSAEHIVNLERNLVKVIKPALLFLSIDHIMSCVKINNLIFWGKTIMGEDFRSAILPLIPKVFTYLALDMWEVSNADRQAIQDAIDELDHSELRVNIYPTKLIEPSRKNVKRSLPNAGDEDFQSKKRKLLSNIKPTRNRRGTLIVADRMVVRIQKKISQFLESNKSDELDLSYLPLHQSNAADVGDALIKKKTMKTLKLRSCLKQGFIQHLQRYLGEVSQEPPVIVYVDVSANPKFGVENAMILGNLLKTWKTTCLDLSECHLTFEEIVSLRESAATHVIPELLYNNNVLSPRTLTALSSFLTSSCITVLHLENCNLKEEHLDVLESRINQTKLETLDLSYNREMTCKGYAAVGRTVHKSCISSVIFVDCDAVLQELQSFQIELKGKSLKHLNLSYNDELVEDDSKREVAKTLVLIRPDTLSLSGCGVDAEMLQEMANSSIGDKLTHLDLRDNPQLGQDSVEVVTTIVEKLSLDILDIENCGWCQSDIFTLSDSVKIAVGTANRVKKCT